MREDVYTLSRYPGALCRRFVVILTKGYLYTLYSYLTKSTFNIASLKPFATMYLHADYHPHTFQTHDETHSRVASQDL